MVRNHLPSLIHDAKLFQTARNLYAGRHQVGALSHQRVKNDQGEVGHRQPRGRRVDLGGKGRQALPCHLFRNLLGPVETGSHLAVHLVYAAATDGIVGMVFEQVLPGLPNQSTCGGTRGFSIASDDRHSLAAGDGRQGGEWLSPSFQHGLDLGVALFDPHPR